MNARVPAALLVSVLLACTGPGLNSPTEVAPDPSIPWGLAPRPGRPAHVLLVSIAGLTPETYLADPPSMPTVAALARTGVAAEVVEPVSPASTYPTHASLVTGVVPARHGIAADFLIGDRGVRRVRHSHASLLAAPSLWGEAAERGLRVAALAWPTTIGAAIPWLLPDVVPARRGENWLDLIADAGTPELAELTRRLFAEEGSLSPGARDRVHTQIACALLGRPDPPALVLLRLAEARFVIARDGPSSSSTRAALRNQDASVARLLGCLDTSGLSEQSALVLVGDHGAVPVHTEIRPNVLLEGAGLLTRSRSGIVSWDALARSNGGSAFVYARNAADAVDARRALRESARDGVFRIVSAEEMLSLGADPDAWFGLQAKPGYVFENESAGPLLRATLRRGASGYLPLEARMGPGFVALGRGLGGRVRIPVMRQIDVAPTVAALLRVSLEESDGRVLVGALRLGDVEAQGMEVQGEP